MGNIVMLNDFDRSGGAAGPARRLPVPSWVDEAQRQVAYDPLTSSRASRTFAVQKAAKHPQAEIIARLAWDLCAFCGLHGDGGSTAKMKREDRPLHLHLDQRLLTPAFAEILRLAMSCAGVVMVCAGVVMPRAHEGRRGLPVEVRVGCPWLTAPEIVAPLPPLTDSRRSPATTSINARGRAGQVRKRAEQSRAVRGYTRRTA